MHIFRDYTFAWWQMGILKVALLAIGVVIGASWPEVLRPYVAVLAATGIVLGAYLAVVAQKGRRR